MRHIVFFASCIMVLAVLVFVAVNETRKTLELREPDYTSSTSSSSVSSAASVPLLYKDYDARLVASGSAAILFFAEKSDPFSAKHDALLQRLSRSGALKIPVYRLEFGSSTGARITYGAIVPDTFVLLDAKKARSSSLIHPTDAELLTALLQQTSSSSSSRKK